MRKAPSHCSNSVICSLGAPLQKTDPSLIFLVDSAILHHSYTTFSSSSSCLSAATHYFLSFIMSQLDPYFNFSLVYSLLYRSCASLPSPSLQDIMLYGCVFPCVCLQWSKFPVRSSDTETDWGTVQCSCHKAVLH